MRIFIITLLLAVCWNCGDQPQRGEITWQDYPDILDYRLHSDSIKGWPQNCFYDMGSWDGYTLPADTTYYGSFIGPFLSPEKKWLTKSLCRFSVFNRINEITYHPQKANISMFHSYPGRLTQQYHFDDLSVYQTLIFASSRSALIEVKMKNNTDRSLFVDFTCRGEIETDEWKLALSNNDVEVVEKYGGIKSTLQFNNFKGRNTLISEDGKSYQTSLSDVLLPAGQSVSSYVIISVHHSNQAVEQEVQKAKQILSNPIKYLEKNELRWNGYLNKILNGKNVKPDWQIVAVKSLQTLIGNWKSQLGDLKGEGLIPSSAVSYFNGFWAWDSWKHAVALTRFAPKLAKNQIRVMFEYQTEDGFLPDCVYTDSSEDNWRDTKPPLASWAVNEVYQQTGDLEFLIEMFPRLMLYHRWWYKYRDHDQSGLCEYGSQDGTLIAARWESGMDNAVRFDQAGMIKNANGGWSMDQESVDLNSYLCMEKRYLSSMALKMGKTSLAEQLNNEVELLKTKIQTMMYDSLSGYFYDIKLEDKSLIKVKGPEGWIPLWTEVADEKQAAAIVKVMMDSSHFATNVPFPTLSKSHPEFSDNYWRGPVWLDQVWFGIEGLKRYGFVDRADQFTEQLIANAQGMNKTGYPIYENYHPVTGIGLNAAHFSWSAAALLMLIP